MGLDKEHLTGKDKGKDVYDKQTDIVGCPTFRLAQKKDYQINDENKDHQTDHYPLCSICSFTLSDKDISYQQNCHYGNASNGNIVKFF